MGRKILQTIFGCILMACLLYLGVYNLQRNAWNRELDKIRDMVNNTASQTPAPTATNTPSPSPTITPSATPSASPSPTLSPTPTSVPTSTPVPENAQVLEKYQALYNKNNDLAAWIIIKDADANGTDINYPVMHIPGEISQTGSDYYYLTHDFNKYRYQWWDEWQPGCLFIDGRCSMKPLRSGNIIVYGHKMQNGTMFAGLLKFRDEAFYQAHKTFTFDTIYSEDTYEIAMVITEKLSGDNYFNFLAFIDFPNEATFNYYVENCKTYQLYETGVELKYGDELVTLVTCLDDNNDGNRIAVIARKIK